MQHCPSFAALDLGSNSFRLEIGQLDNGRLRQVTYIKETVRQGQGLDADHILSNEAMERGWACLARFGERIAGLHPDHVRAVATQTLREASNRDVFLSQARDILGFPVEVISGREEARLIYLGVSHLLPDSDERRLVVDIGGRSTEMVLGQRHVPQTLASYRIGSAAWSMAYFPDGRWTSDAFKTAEIAAKAVLDEALSAYPREHWDKAYGASGTIGAVADALQAHGWPQGTITPEALDWLQDKLVKAQHPAKLRLEGLKDDRKPVLGGGLAVLRAVFDLLQIETMHPAQGALRHGALFDLLARENPHTDVRTRMIDWLAQHFSTDVTQAERVSRTAQHLFGQAIGDNRSEAAVCSSCQLQWAAQVHEIGKQISHSNYHKHGAYILENTDLQGFTVDELHRLGLLVLGQRGKLNKMQAPVHDAAFVLQWLCLRLAVILCHARCEPDLAGIRLKQAIPGKVFELAMPQKWQCEYPQSAHLLREESAAWPKIGIRLDLRPGTT